MIRKNTKLKLAIFEKDISQAELARQTGIPPAILSMAVQGKYNLDQEQMKAIAEKIGREVTEIFPK